ncbi:MAG: efflux RND transporter permease subunit [Sulfurimonas sp.]|nr:efflux RND transporter permease subunit [Sulfurimonas sp.]
MSKEFQPRNIASKLTKEFIHNPITPFFIGLILVLGVMALLITPREENPQIIVSGGGVIIALPGVDAQTIKKVVVEPLEQKIREIKGVENIIGIAKDDIGIVNVSYYMGTNKESADLKLYDKVIHNISLLPKGAMMPLVKTIDIDNDLPIVTVALYPLDSDIKKSATFDKARELQRVIGGIKNVSKVIVKGGSKEQYNIFVDLGKLSGFHISLAQVSAALESLSTNVPDVYTTTKNNKERVVIEVRNALRDVSDIENIIIASYNNSSIYLRDIAEVQRGYDIQNKKYADIKFRDANGKFTSVLPQTTLEISKLSGSNAVFVSSDIKELLELHKDALKAEGIGYKITRDDGDRANDSVNELVYHIFLATLFITVLMWVVLGWKESLIVTLTVPLVVAISLVIVYIYGMTLNRVTMFGFLLTMGLLVDAGIIVIENIHRHMHKQDKDMEYLCIEAVDEIGVPTNIATIAIIFTSLPALLVGKMMGQFIAPIPIIMSVVLLMSLAIGYTVVPYLAKKYMKK